MKSIRVEIITIGDELLIGQVIDTNSAWMANQLNAEGIDVYQITSVSDQSDHIKSALKAACSRVDIVLVTGGLGPTKDDITKQSLADFFESSAMVIHQESLDYIKSRFDQTELSLINQQQALVPNNCKVIRNTCGTAPGMWFNKEGIVVVAMPGVPREMKLMFIDVLALLKKQFNCPAIYHRTIMTYGLPESSLSDLIEDWELNLPRHMNLAYLPELASGVKLRLSAKGHQYDQLKEEVDSTFELLRPTLAKVWYGHYPETLAQVVGKLLQTQKASVAVAESCTGGLIAHRFTSVPGASAYFKGGIIAYHNQVKIDVLKVDAGMLAQQGAVSKQVAQQMAEGIKQLLQSDYAIATTGVAGPGGTPTKPMGLCWIAIAGPKQTICWEINSKHDRTGNIETAASQAINKLRLLLLEDQE